MGVLQGSWKMMRKHTCSKNEGKIKNCAEADGISAQFYPHTMMRPGKMFFERPQEMDIWSLGYDGHFPQIAS